jgi:hypothetical protein
VHLRPKRAGLAGVLRWMVHARRGTAGGAGSGAGALTVKITRAILADSRIPQKLSNAQRYSSAIVEMLRFSSPGGKRLATYAHASDAETTAVAMYLRRPRNGQW